VVGYLVAIFSVKDEDAPGGAAAAAAAGVVHGAMEPAVDWAKCPGLLRNGRSWSSLQATEPSNGPMFLVKYCNLTSLTVLADGSTRLSHVPLRLAIRRIPNLVHDSTLHTSVSNVHARVSESSPHCHCGAPRLSHIKHWVQCDEERDADLAICPPNPALRL
jgi:hypothetical protein